jgi:hypothetical protein
MRVRSLTAALVLAAGTLAWAVPAVLAECPPRDGPADRHLDVGYAFTATVTELSSQVDPPREGNADFDWHVVLDVDRTYRGEVPAEIVFNGWTAQCWFGVRGDQLHLGERVFVAGQRLRLERFPTDPFSGDLALWTWTGQRWKYARDVLTYDRTTRLDPDSRMVRAASTTTAILALIRSDAPDTSTAMSGDLPDDAPPIALLVSALLIGFSASVWRLRRRSV